jgi:hypothetical protein
MIAKKSNNQHFIDLKEFQKKFMERYNAAKTENEELEKDILVKEIDKKIDAENTKNKKAKKLVK